MKKGIIAIAALILLSFGNINAQDPFDGGRFSVEVEFIPNLNGGNFFDIPMGLSGSYRLNNGDKIFVGIQLDNYNNTDGAVINQDDENYDRLKENYTKTSITNVMLFVDYLHYFIKEGRVRPYIGGFVGIGRDFGKKHEYQNYYNGIDDAWYYKETTEKSYNCNFSWSLGAELGFDVYLTKGLYIGTGVMLYGNMVSRLDSKIEVESNDPAVKNSVTEFYNKHRDGNILTQVSARLHLGWEF